MSSAKYFDHFVYAYMVNMVTTHNGRPGVYPFPGVVVNVMYHITQNKDMIDIVLAMGVWDTPNSNLFKNSLWSLSWRKWSTAIVFVKSQYNQVGKWYHKIA